MSTLSQSESRKVLVAGYCRKESNNMNIVNGILLIIYEYQRFAKWSSIHKGKDIKLSEDDSKATCSSNNRGHAEKGSVRADTCIERGQIISWSLECYITGDSCNFIGVVSSHCVNFNGNPYWGLKHAYGIDDWPDAIYNGAGSCSDCKWQKPKLPIKELFKIKVMVDWTDERCKLSFYYNGKKLNEENEEYTIVLPEFDDDILLYPCVTPFNKDAYFKIEYD